MPRFRITIRQMMVAVALVAIDVAVMRAYLNPMTHGPVNYEVMVLVSLPMANILALALLSGRWRPAYRRSMVAFVACGGLVMAFYVAWIWLSFDTFSRCWRPIMMPIGAALRRWPTIKWPTLWTSLYYGASMTILLVPQLLLAELGARLIGRVEGLPCSTQPIAPEPK